MAKVNLKNIEPNLKNYYSVDEHGNFWSVNKKTPLLTRNKSGTNYQIINLTMENGSKKTYIAHRLVLRAFLLIENESEMQVNHKDGNKKNNQLENLEWVTPSDNQIHAFKNGLQKSRKGEDSNFSRLKKEDITTVFELKEKGWLQKDIAEAVGC